ncbi:copper resistance CopC/CopD family protein [Aquibium microcysteis]|uniref:copper resistance CopC/CopD family protein n=1 Tax=Aquibium microcysteis TaxID=675281 RepID=UPI001EF2D12E|nr:CopD family protein [Aquibium microcysteis]
MLPSSMPIEVGRRAGASFLAKAILALALLFAGTAGALAHASLASADPADGAVVAMAPSGIALTFSEIVSPLVMRLVTPDGASRDLSDVAYSGNTLRVALPDGLSDGTHVFSWRVVSEDGHPVGGSLIFSIGAPSAMPGAQAEAVDWPVRGLVWASKLLLTAGIAFGIGGVFALSWFGTGRDVGRGVAAGFVVAGMIAAVLAVGAQGLDALAKPVTSLLHPTVWLTGLDTSFGRTALGLLVASAAAMVAIVLPGPAGRAPALIALLGAGAAVAASGHAGSAEPQWLTRPMVALHVATMAAWIGALMPLGLALRAGGEAATVLLGRFSRSIPWLLVVLVASGGVLAFIQVQTPAALVTTAYGRVLLVKLALVALLLVLAAFNRWRLTPAAARDDAAARRALLRAIVAELLLAVLILGAAATWRFTPPPRALARAAAEPAWVHLHDPRVMADVTVMPGVAGPVAVSAALQGGDFGPFTAKAVTLVLSRPDAGIEPIRRDMAAEEGVWRAGDLVLPLPGRWSLRVDVLVSDFERVRLEGEVDIRP